MTIIEIILISVSLAMDAFVVSVCKGLSIIKIKFKECLLVGLWFGVFQALMPTIGFFLGHTFESFIVSIDHWVAFVLLLFIGGKMICETLKGEENVDGDLGFRSMLMLAIATSIDALAVGIAYVCVYQNKNAFLCFSLIGIITFVISSIGVVIGNKFGNKFEKVASLFGGLVLVLLGTKILLEHLFSI